MSRLQSWLPKSFSLNFRKPRRFSKSRKNLLQVLCLEDRTTPATFTVNSLLDTVTADGNMTLREAVTAVNLGNNSALSAAEKLLVSGTFGTADTVVFTGLAGTITLGGTQIPAFTKNLTLTGPGAASLSISGNALSRIFTNNSGITSAISGLTLTNGKIASDGGAVVNSGNLTITNSIITGNSGAFGGGISSVNGTTLSLVGTTVSNNTAGNGGGIAMYQSSSLSMSNCVISSNSTTGFGGGLYYFANSSATILDSQFTGNKAADGGGLGLCPYNGNTVNLTRVTVDANSATNNGGGIALATIGSSNHKSTIIDSTISNNKSDSDLNGAGNGGGIYVSANATLTVATSAFLGNAALDSASNTADGNGGGLRNEGTAILDNVTFTTNTANREGGGISNAGTLTLTNATMTANTGNADADGFGSGGALATNATATLTNSLLWNNSTAFSGGSKQDITGVAFATSKNNLIFNDLTGSIVNGVNGNITGITAALLSTLGTYGGITQSFPLLPGSPAIDAGLTGSLTLDQRGKTRSFDSLVDIGAFEYQGATVTISSGSNQSAVNKTNFANPLVANITALNAGDPVNGGLVTFTAPGSGASATPVTQSVTIASGKASASVTANETLGAYSVITAANSAAVNFALSNVEASSLLVTTETDVVSAFDSLTSLREAIAFANTQAGADVITFSVNFNSAKTITLGGTELAINQAVTITGPGANLLTITGNNASRIFNTTSSAAAAVITITGMTLTGGFTATDGGAVIIGDETVTITDCILTGNSAADEGGAIFANPGTLNLSNSTLSGNTGNTGGAVYLRASSALIVGSAFTGNRGQSSGGLGGGALSFNGTIGSGGLTIRNSTFTANTSNSAGGAIQFRFLNGTANIQSSTIVGNVGGALAGGIRRTTQGGNPGTGKVSLESTIVSGNFFGATPGDISDVNVAVDVVNSALGVGTGFTFGTNTGNIVGANLLLGALGTFGGTTQTIPLLPGSPAINAGSNTAGATLDQRGKMRSVSTTDIGAFESQGTTLTVTSGSGQTAPLRPRLRIRFW